MALGLIQGALGQPFASAVEGPAFAILNEMLGAYHTDGGFARPARYEVILQMENELGKKIIELDARPSDSIGLALQMKQPIHVSNKVLENVEDMTEILERILRKQD